MPLTLEAPAPSLAQGLRFWGSRFGRAIDEVKARVVVGRECSDRGGLGGDEVSDQRRAHQVWPLRVTYIACIMIVGCCGVGEASAQQGGGWSLEGALGWSRFEQQVKAEVGGATGERLVSRS